jgi:prepilin-type N-terminal cleavage/methylation domain-containing protein
MAGMVLMAVREKTRTYTPGRWTSLRKKGKNREITLTNRKDDRVTASSVTRRTGKGFTLIELVVVVAIIGMLLASVAIRFDSLTVSARLRASAREIASTIGLAHSRASSTGRAQTLVFDTDNQQYWIDSSSEEGDASESPRIRSLYRSIAFKDIQVGEELYGERGTLSIEISPLGVTSACMIHLEAEGGGEMTLEVCPLTGSVRFYDGYREYEPPEVIG